MDSNSIDPKEWAKFETWKKGKEKRQADKKAVRKKRSEEIEVNWGGLQTELRDELSKSITDFDWKKEGLLSNNRRQRVDIMGVSKSRTCRVGIELERDRATCVRNVIKVWMSMRQDQRYFLLIHIFSPVFDDEKRTFLEEAEFVGEKASADTNGRLMYKPIQLEQWPSVDPTLVIREAANVKNLVTAWGSKVS